MTNTQKIKEVVKNNLDEIIRATFPYDLEKRGETYFENIYQRVEKKLDSSVDTYAKSGRIILEELMPEMIDYAESDKRAGALAAALFRDPNYAQKKRDLLKHIVDVIWRGSEAVSREFGSYLFEKEESEAESIFNKNYFLRETMMQKVKRCFTGRRDENLRAEVREEYECALKEAECKMNQFMIELASELNKSESLTQYVTFGFDEHNGTHGTIYASDRKIK